MAAMWNKKTCPVCEKGELTKIIENVEFEYNNMKIEFKGVTVFKCNVCSEEFVEDKYRTVIDYTLSEYRRNIDIFFKTNA